MPNHDQHLTDDLKSLQKALFDLSARNPFVNVSPAQLWFVDDTGHLANRHKIYQKAKFFEKEYALKTALLVHVFIRWKVPGHKEFFTSPLLYQPCTITVKKRIETTWTISVDDHIYHINPVLRKTFADHFAIDLPAETEDPAALSEYIKSEFDSSGSSIGVLQDFNDSDNWQIIEKKAAGVFNYKKSLLHADFDEVITAPGKTIQSLFGERYIQKPPVPVPQPLTQLDESQQKAFSLALSENAVIQGPPGTGKSHTVAAIITSLLAQGKSVLFVSEKRSALDVVYDRLKKEKLDHLLAYFNTEKDEKKAFYAHLKKTWSKASSTPGFKEKPVLSGIFRADDLFSIYPVKLKSLSPSTGTSIYCLQEKLLESGYAPGELIFNGNVPAYTTWHENLELLYHLESRITTIFRTSLIQDTAFSKLSALIFSDPLPINKLTKTLAEIQRALSNIYDLQRAYGLQRDLEAFTRLAIAGSIFGMVNKNQLDLIKPGHKLFRSFNTLAKKYELTKNKLSQAELVTKKWRKKPTIGEITIIAGQLKHQKKPKSILGILRRNSSRETDYFAGFPGDLNTVTKLQLLEELRAEWHLRGELEAIRIKLKHDLNITDPDNEINHIMQVRSKLDTLSQNDYVTILEHENSLALIRDLRAAHGEISRLNSQLNYLFHVEPPTDPGALAELITNIQFELPLITRFHHEMQLYFNLPREIIDFLHAAKFSIHQSDAVLTNRLLQAETRFLPGFKDLGGNALYADFTHSSRQDRDTAEMQLSGLRERPLRYLQESEKLLSVSASKLKPADKKRKLAYKNEKRILIHELNKKQQHLPVKKLVENCNGIISNLQPAWMMNPLAVAQHLPCKARLFDVVIFDEASQVPLEDAIPAIYRGAHLIVVGDEQQMPPGRFFASQPGVQTLLDQASGHLKAGMLKWHYRSEHPSLIEFSNRTFYDYELIAMPPLKNEKAIELYQVSGIFEKQYNSVEAAALAQHYAQLLSSGVNDIGIIAFSKEQQLEIEKQIKALEPPVNENLMVRNLENVQGIEKEIILISISYARNKAGLFRKNFGPVNQEKGANRLNVLFTRAIKKMIIFTSVTSADFKLSHNRGATVLADFLRYAETAALGATADRPIRIAHRLVERMLIKNKIHFSFYAAHNGIAVNCFIQHETGRILLVDPGMDENETNDINALLFALKQRFQKIQIVTINELLTRQEATEQQLVSFFRES